MRRSRPDDAIPVDPYRATLVLLQTMQHAFAAYDSGDWKAAEQNCRSVLDARPDYFDALNLVGIIAAQTGRHEEAVEYLQRAVASRPGAASAHTNLGSALREIRRHLEALASYDRALGIRPDYPEAHDNRGLTLQRLGRFEEALADHERALQLQPAYPAAHLNRGNALQALRRFDDAIVSYDRGLRLEPSLVEALINRGNALTELGRLDDALESYRRALEIEPRHADAHYARGVALDRAGRLDEALASYAAATRIQPDHADAQWNKSLVLLAQGRLAEGLALYEWRWKRPGSGLRSRDFAQPLWLGAESLVGRTILLHGEQGLGDTIHFCRYATLVAQLGARVVLEVQAPLVAVMRHVEGVHVTLARGEPLPEFDFHCPLLSLPLALATELGTIPAPARYIACDQARLRAWEERLGTKQRPRVGVVWSGGTLSTVRERSIPLVRFAEMLGGDVEFISLQKEVRESDRVALEARRDIRHFGDALADFSDTAALCDLMDLIVTIDTSVAHLAGALGRPVWILLRQGPDWRWFLERRDSPWYQSARLYRQARSDDWDEVLRWVRADLLSRFA